MIGPLSVSDLPAVKIGDTWRVLGCLKETEETKSRFPVFGESALAAAPLDPSQWQEIDLSYHKLGIKNQSTTSACVGFSSASAMEMCYVQSGRPQRQFNPWFTYALINRNRDAGAYISDSLVAMQDIGACDNAVGPSRLSYKGNLTQAQYDNAKKKRLIRAYRCANYNEICSAITLGFPCVLGVPVGGNFDSIDSEGVTPVPNWVRGGHAILGLGLRKSSRYGWTIKFQNSWGNWGLGGYAYLQKGSFDGTPDAFALQMIEVDVTENDPTEIPVVK